MAGTLAEALVAFQKDAPKIERNKTVKVRTEKGTYEFSYATLDTIFAACRPNLAEQNLAVSQMLITSEAGHPALRTVLMHADGGGTERMEADFPLPLKGGESAQQIGSLISYMRRYALISILGLAPDEDDDANAATGNAVIPKAKPKEAAPKPAAAGTPPPGHSSAEDVEGLTASILAAAEIVQALDDAYPDLVKRTTKVIADQEKALPPIDFRQWLTEQKRGTEELARSLEARAGLVEV